MAANVTATTTPAPPILPADLLFVAPQGGAPVTQRYTVNVSSLTPVEYEGSLPPGLATVISAKEGPVLSTTNSPGYADLTFNPTASAVQQLINIRTPGGLLRTTRVNAIAVPPNCQSTGMWIRETSLVERFSIPVGLPQPLTVQVTDNCGNRLKGSLVSASFSNGDPSLLFTQDERSGDYTATWTPQTALTSPVTITLRAIFNGRFNRTLAINGTVQGNAAPSPFLVPGGILNNLNPIVGAPLAPGTIAQIYGDNFYSGSGFESAAPPPLNPTLKGAKLLVSGFPAPFFYLSKTQAAAQIPTELRPNLTYQALMEVDGAFSVPQAFDLVAASPGAVSYDGSIVAQHASTYQLVSADNPASPGESLVFYLVGMGATSPSVPTGAPAPAEPLARASLPPGITIGGQTAAIQYAGLTPGFAGLYQINLAVPATAPDGNLDVVITQGGFAANPGKLPVKK